MPKGLEINQKLCPYEQLGVIEALFYTINTVYREDILYRRITLELMTQLLSWYELLHLKPQGFVQDGQRIHFDQFRRKYFGKKMA